MSANISMKEITNFTAHFLGGGWAVNFFSSYMESGPRGMFWTKERHLEHPEKVVFLPERGRKRVKEWRDATFMKE